ncbi:MAG: NnrU family protein [Pseudomonadota bacterium]
MSVSTLMSFALLIAGLALFMGLHLLRELGLRDAWHTRLGPRLYRLLFSLGILLSLLLIVQGKSGAPFIQLWVPPFNQRSLTQLVMLSATMLFIAGSLPHSFTRELLIHPMLIGVILWGSSHLLSNGDLVSVLIFGSLPLWALLKVVSLERVRQQMRKGAGPSASSSPSHSPSQSASHPGLQWDAAAIVLGVIAYSVLLLFHGQLFGIALIAPV